MAISEKSLSINIFQRNLDNLRLAVGVGCEVEHTRARRALCQVVVLAHGHCRHEETLYKGGTSLAVAVDNIIYSALVVLLEHLHMQNVLAYKYLVGSTYHLVFAVFEEDDDVVDVGAVAHKLVLLQTRADESLLSVDVQLLVGLHHL